MILLLSTASSAWACSCVEIETKPVSEQIHSNAIFVGRAIESRYYPQGNEITGRAITKFKLEKSIRGEFGQTVDVIHNQNGAACGLFFEFGRIELIIAEEINGQYYTSYCSYILPEIMVINFFEKGENPTLMSPWECKEKDLLITDPNDNSPFAEKTASTAACKIFTNSGKHENYKLWKDWLNSQEFFNEIELHEIFGLAKPSQVARNLGGSFGGTNPR